MTYKGKKILTICEWGNSRSVALAWLLKDQHGADALACGICAASPETFHMLCEWADIIIVTFGPIARDIDMAFLDKVKVWDVGQDRYFLGYVPELLDKYKDYINKDI